MEYVNDKDFTELLIKYRKTKSKKVHNEIGKCFILIATRLLNKWNFTSYTFDRKDEMVSLALLYMSKYMNNFDENKGSAFAYFTQYAYHAFQQYIIDRKRYDCIFKTSQFIENMTNCGYENDENEEDTFVRN